MLRFLKKTVCAGLLVGAAHGAFGFSLLGPFDTWQVDSLSYTVGFSADFYEVQGVGDLPIGGPMNLGEEYRWNIPVLYWAVDQSFLDYFGSNGVAAIQQAFSILNGITNASSYSAALSEVPQETTRVNFRAQALGLLDVKTIALKTILEELGLADPVRYTWCLRVRALPPGAMCPFYDYLVIKRNFDPVTWEPSSYVNGTLYTYRIAEFCPLRDRAEAFEHRVDPLQSFYTAVASLGIFDGSFYTGLTRDDVGGLRYLLSKNNVNLEDSGPGTLTLVTNNNSSLLTTSNLTLFSQQALTNDQATLQALYPDLAIVSVTNIFTNIATTNVFAFFTNEPWATAGTPAKLAFATNVTFSVQTLFQYAFANLFTFQLTTNGFVAVNVPSITFSTNRSIVTIQTLVATNNGGFSSGGSTNATTNVFNRTFVTNQISGEFFIVPTNVCDISIIAPVSTNVQVTSTLLMQSTNIAGATNVNNQFFSQTRFDFSTNHTFVVRTILCLSTNFVALNQGVEKLTFVRRDFDSLLGTFFEPITNEYVLNSVTNSRVVPLRVRRISTAPDFLFSADDLVTPPTVVPIIVSYIARSANFNSNHALLNLPGPGTIQPTVSITYNKVGPPFYNFGPFFLDEPSNIAEFIYGSFDGSTNAPIVYPSGTSIADYENLLLIQVTTGSLPNGSVGLSYSAQLQGSGGQPPYTWSLSPGSSGLPPGLGQFSGACSCWTLPANGNISGSPTTAGTYFFTARMTDSGGRSVTKDFSIIINP